MSQLDFDITVEMNIIALIMWCLCSWEDILCCGFCGDTFPLISAVLCDNAVEHILSSPSLEQGCGKYIKVEFALRAQNMFG